MAGVGGGATPPLRVAHVITDLDVGGSQRALHRLVSRLDRGRYRVEVASLTVGGLFADRLAARGVPVRLVGMGWTAAGALRGMGRLVGGLRAFRPHLVHTWLYHADLAGGVAAALAGRVPTIWGVRNGRLTREEIKRTTWWTARVCARLSRALPSRIVANSEAARAWHVRFGYASDRFDVIPNGFDLDRFRPDPAARRRVRGELGLDEGDEDVVLIGLIANSRPEKDHGTFVRAAARLASARPEVRFLLCGKGITASNRTLSGWITDEGLAGRVHLLGVRDDVPALCAALDVATLSSRIESFPNVIGEAMACGVPAVVTDVGDAAEIVGETGSLVPPGRPDRLAEAWERMVAIGPAGRSALGARARRRVEERYEISAIVGRYEALYEEVAGNVRNRRPA